MYLHEIPCVGTQILFIHHVTETVQYLIYGDEFRCWCIDQSIHFTEGTALINLKHNLPFPQLKGVITSQLHGVNQQQQGTKSLVTM